VAVLTSWKEIANYCGKGQRTIQRWEHLFGFPIRRPHPKSHIILARTEEIDEWIANNSGRTWGELERMQRRLQALEAENQQLRETLAMVMSKWLPEGKHSKIQRARSH
jgi:hypothetical protein